jgi:hypothetical protein
MVDIVTVLPEEHIVVVRRLEGVVLDLVDLDMLDLEVGVVVGYVVAVAAVAGMAVAVEMKRVKEEQEEVLILLHL